MSSKLKSVRTRRTAVGASAAGLLAAALFMPATGADFTASDTGDLRVNTATLSVDLGAVGDGQTFALAVNNLAPGESQVKSFDVTNTGSIPANVTLRYMNQNWAPKGKAEPLDKSLLTVSANGTNAVSLPGLNKSSIDLGQIEPGETITVDLALALDQSAGNDWQGASLSGDALVTLTQVN